MRSRRSCRRPVVVERSAFAGYRFPPEVILLAVRWYLRFSLSYRDVEELLAERGVEVDHVTIFRWVHHFTPELIEASRPCRHAIGGRWFVDETYVRVAGVWRYVYRAVDQHGQVIDILVSARRDGAGARRFVQRVLGERARSEQVTTDKAKALIGAVRDVSPEAEHDMTVDANNRVECDHGRLKARLRPMRGLQTDRTATVVNRGHAFVQNLRRGHYELGVHAFNDQDQVAAAFDELAQAI